MFKEISLKLGNARKPQEYTIYPYNGDGFILIQSDTRIARVDMTGKGIASNPHSNGAYGSHLALERNPIQLTQKEITELKLIVLGEGEELDHEGWLKAEQKLDGITF